MVKKSTRLKRTGYKYSYGKYTVNPSKLKIIFFFFVFVFFCFFFVFFVFFFVKEEVTTEKTEERIFEKIKKNEKKKLITFPSLPPSKQHHIFTRKISSDR